MERTDAELEKQIEQWRAEKRDAVAKLNMLEGAIQAFQVLLAQDENGAGEDIPALNEGQTDGDTEAH